MTQQVLLDEFAKQLNDACESGLKSISEAFEAFQTSIQTETLRIKATGLELLKQAEETQHDVKAVADIVASALSRFKAGLAAVGE